MADNKDKKVLNVPALRFPEFSGEWDEYAIGEILSIGNGRDYKHLHNGDIPVFGTGGYMTSVDDFLYDGESVFVGRKGTINKPLYYNGKFWTVDTLFYTYNFTDVLPKFVYCLFQTINWLKYNEASGVPSLSKATIEKIKVRIPSMDEQDKLSNLLFLLDKRIEVQNKIIEKYESLIQAIIYKAKIDGISKGTWRRIDLCKVLQERNEKNVNGRTICSVSVSQGVVNQIEYLGRSFAAKQTSHYNVVKYGDIVYTKSPTGDFPYGIIKRSNIRDDVAVSPLYGVYIPVNDSIGVILHFYFMRPSNAFNYLHPLIQKGAKNTINITNGRFLENSIPLPISENDTNTIAGTLKSIQEKIEIEKSLLQSYTKEKEYLLRQMFI
ncbi:restriction endonuclease subunit S [Bacteroides sp. An19]|uniref:restriction endonuclease subunit S n=1 Tax=Bacteroides sp. An19 TaxID=1965580 RepID=UPI00112341E8|nr:restriction endonuclease subunit S [Bacteroides sp. An19]